MLTLNKPAAIINYQKSMMERYNPKIYAEFGSVDEALDEINREDTTQYQHNAVEGYEVIYKDEDGEVMLYDGLPFDMTTYPA